MKRNTRSTLIVGAMLITAILVYLPHVTYPLPFHTDEWHHITEGLKLSNGEYRWNQHPSLEIGIHLVLAVLSRAVDLVTNYQYFAAIAAGMGALSIYLLVKTTTRSFGIGLASILFFASIKSNRNLTGLFFFTPLTLSIPIMFLIAFLFTKGWKNENKHLIGLSVLAEAGLGMIHPISALFIALVLVCYATLHRKHAQKLAPALGMYAAVILMGIILLHGNYIWKGSLQDTLAFLINLLTFRHGWGQTEIIFNIITLYGPISILLAGIGAYAAWKKHFDLLILWPAIAIVLIIPFLIFKATIIAPYQRLLYYLMLGLAPLSAIGLSEVMVKAKALATLKLKGKHQWTPKAITFTIVVLVALAAFQGYYNPHPRVKLTQLIDAKDFEALKYLNQLPKGKVLAPPKTAMAVYPIAQHDVVGAYFFYGKRHEVEDFFKNEDCDWRNEFIEVHGATFIISPVKTDCGWILIYDRAPFIYKMAP